MIIPDNNIFNNVRTHFAQSLNAVSCDMPDIPEEEWWQQRFSYLCQTVHVSQTSIPHQSKRLWQTWKCLLSWQIVFKKQIEVLSRPYKRDSKTNCIKPTIYDKNTLGKNKNTSEFNILHTNLQSISSSAIICSTLLLDTKHW
jgi:hypothetical protein